MTAGKYEEYRVVLKEISTQLSISYDLAQICAKFILNEIEATEVMKLLDIKAAFIERYTAVFSGLVLLENLDTEQFCCLYVALWGLDHCNYYDRTRTEPVSLRLNQEFVDKIIKEVFIDREAGETCKSEEFANTFKDYPNTVKFGGLIDQCCFIMFADLWSRAVNQVVPLDLLLLTN